VASRCSAEHRRSRRPRSDRIGRLRRLPQCELELGQAASSSLRPQTGQRERIWRPVTPRLVSLGPARAAIRRPPAGMSPGLGPSPRGRGLRSERRGHRTTSRWKWRLQTCTLHFAAAAFKIADDAVAGSGGHAAVSKSDLRQLPKRPRTRCGSARRRHVGPRTTSRRCRVGQAADPRVELRQAASRSPPRPDERGQPFVCSTTCNSCPRTNSTDRTSRAVANKIFVARARRRWLSSCGRAHAVAPLASTTTVRLPTTRTRRSTQLT